MKTRQRKLKAANCRTKGRWNPDFTPTCRRFNRKIAIFFADYCSGRVMRLQYLIQGGNVIQLAPPAIARCRLKPIAFTTILDELLRPE